MINWLVIGIGDISRKRVIPAILLEPRSRLHSILTRDPAKARDYPDDAHIYTDLDDALANRRIDAVYVATPVALHESQTVAALSRGKHVLCEKAAAVDFGGATRMKQASDRSGKLLGIAYYRRLFPKLIDAKRRIEAGEIGTPVLGEANCHGWLPPAQRGWLFDPDFAGAGPLYDVACHRIDAFNFLFGNPARAAGLVSNVVHKMAVEDSATVIVDYASGPRAIVDVRWNSHPGRDQFRIVGTDGAIDLSPLSDGQHPHGNVHYPLIENFVSACLGEAPLVCPIEESLETDRVLHAVRFEQPLDRVHA